MSRYVLSPESLLELEEIWKFIAQDDTDAADRWIAELLDACETLARNPRIGHTRDDIADKSVLFWPVGKYLIIYRQQPGHIDIAAITQGSRNIPSYLRKRS